MCMYVYVWMCACVYAYVQVHVGEGENVQEKELYHILTPSIILIIRFKKLVS